MSLALGTFEQNWTLDCVCDECNKYFGDNLELPLGRDSREALLRLELGLKPASEAAQLLNRRVTTRLSAPGFFDGMRMVLLPSEGGTQVAPAPVAQVKLRRPSESWRFFQEEEITQENLRTYLDAPDVEVGVLGVGPDLDRLRRRLAEAGIEFTEAGRLTNAPITEQDRLTVVHDIDVDETIVRAGCKIGFNYAAKMLGAAVVRRASFDGARRFVRHGEAPTRVATVQRRSILVGPDAVGARVHVCAIGWDSGYLCAAVSLFNEMTYGLALSRAEPNEFAPRCHFFDPLARAITAAAVDSEGVHCR